MLRTKNGALFFYFARGDFFFKRFFMYVYVKCVTWKRHKRLGIGNVTDHRLWRMANIVSICFSIFYRLTLVQRSWPRATPDFGSVSVILSFLLQDIPRHPDTHLFEVQGAFKSCVLLGFQVHIRAYIAFFSPPARNRRRTTK